MKKTHLRLACELFVIIPYFVFTLQASAFGDPVLSSHFNFEATVVGETIETNWQPWQEDFMWYKLVRSGVNPAPVYPENEAIFTSTNQQTNSFVDTAPQTGKSFYRICVYTYAKDRYCSNTVSVVFPAVADEDSANEKEEPILISEADAENQINAIQTRFGDVEHWTEMGRAIEYFAAKGVVRGFDNNDFRPQQGITRAELTKVVVLAVGFETVPDNPRTFCDIYHDDWFFPFVDALVIRKYVGGYPGGDCPLRRRFRPHNQITRAEATKVILKAFNIQGRPTGENPVTTEISASHWFAPYAKILIDRSILTADELRDFRPDEPATRGEIMLLLKRSSDTSRTPVSDMAPRIIDHFACSDYCPGDQAQYWARIYEGVQTSEECKKWNGKWYAYYQLGGSATVCLADSEQNITTNYVECDALRRCAKPEQCVLDQESQLPRCVADDPCNRCGNLECVIVISSPVENAPLKVICKE